MSTLSVVMANYNHGRYVGGALEAMLSQSARPMEIIVVDDGSTDNSVDVIGEIARRDPVVRLLRNKENRGALWSANRAYREVSGELVYFAAADDTVLPGFFEKSLAMLERHPEAGLCDCGRRSYLPDGSVAKVADPWRPSTKPAYLPPAEVRRIISERGTFITETGVICRRSALEGQLPWRAELGTFVEGFAAHTIALQLGLCYIPEVLVTRRVSPSQLSLQRADDPEHVLGIADRAARLMETEYAHLWPRSFAKEYRRAAARKCGRAIQRRLRARNDDILRRMQEVNARRPVAGARAFYAGLRLATRLTEWGVGAYVRLAYPPSFTRIRLRLGRALRRGG